MELIGQDREDNIGEIATNPDLYLRSPGYHPRESFNSSPILPPTKAGALLYLINFPRIVKDGCSKLIFSTISKAFTFSSVATIACSS